MYNICAFIGFLIITYIAISILAFIFFTFYIKGMDKKEQEEINKIKSNILNGKE